MIRAYRRAAWVLVLGSCSGALGADRPISGSELLEASIAFHDPDGLWRTWAHELTLDESRPDGSTRTTVVGIDILGGRFDWSTTRAGHALAGRLDEAGCKLRLDGKDNPTDGERAQHELTCVRLERIRDYYSFLWGLPMKLRDGGTRLAEAVTETEFADARVLQLRVTYDPEVGGDTWYLYFDPESYALRGYRFFHDEGRNDGEYIILEDLVSARGLRLAKVRAWYLNDGDEYLGTDTLRSLRPVRHGPLQEP